MRKYLEKQREVLRGKSGPSRPGATPRNHEEHPILNLQRTIGNQAVRQLLQAEPDARIPVGAETSIRLQSKLELSTPGDLYEQEADRISEQVMRMPGPQLQRACDCGAGCPKCRTGQQDQERESLQAKSVQSSDTRQIAAPPIVHEVLASPGQLLDEATRVFMEPRFGHDFSQVRVHADAKAAESSRAVNALAYTVGRDVVFGTGQYAPHTSEGRRLLAHELTHVLQQSTSLVRLQRTPAQKQPVQQDSKVGSRASRTDSSGSPTVEHRAAW